MKKIADLIKLKQWAAAEQRLLELKAEKPFDPHLLFHLGTVLIHLQRNTEAIITLRQCVHVAPNYTPALINLSVLFERNGDFRQAIRYAQMAVKGTPRDADLHHRLSLLWAANRNPDYALEANTHALALRPNVAEWRIQRMNLFTFMKRHDEALAEARRIRTLPDRADDLETLLTISGILRSRSAWTELSSINACVARAASQPQVKANPSLLMMSCDDPELIHHLALRYADSMRMRKSLQSPPSPSTDKPKSRVVLGYFTADAREHPVAQMLLEILSRHDRTRFEVVLLHLNLADTSAIGMELHSRVDRAIDLTHDSDSQAIERIRASGVDVLIDVMGLTSDNRLSVLAARPCRAQVLWLGCAVSTGADFYDAYLVDDIVAPAGYEQFCSEPLLRLPCCYHPISVGLHPTKSQATRKDLGIPDRVVMVGLLQQPNRITPEFIEKLARTLAHHREVHFILRVTVAARPSVSAHLTAWGIAPERVHFIQRFDERREYLRLIELLDLVIDSHPYGGHSTTGEALTLGTPVLACMGNSVHSRVAGSMMHDLGLSDLVAASTEDQMAMLNQLLSNSAMLADWKQRFLTIANRPADDRHIRLTRALESAYIATLTTQGSRLFAETIQDTGPINDSTPDA